MRLRNLSVSKKAAYFLLAGFALTPVGTFANTSAKVAASDPAYLKTEAAYLRLDDVNSYVAGKSIEWELKRVGNGETKQLVPTGTIAKSCLYHQGQDASGKIVRQQAKMQLKAHPNPSRANEMVLFINLTDKCQSRDKKLHSANKDYTPDVDGDDSAVELVSLASAFANLQVPGSFSGTISVCALGEGDKNMLGIEKRLQNNCQEITMRDDGADLVEKDGKYVIGAGRRQEIAQQQYAQQQAQQAAEASKQEYQDALQATAQLARSLCDGNLSKMNAALASLSSLGVNVREIGKSAIAASLAQWKKDLKIAKDFDEIEEVEARFLRAEASLRDEASKRNFRMEIANRYIDLTAANISDLSQVDSAEGRTVESNIKTARAKVKDLLPSKEAKEKLAKIEKDLSEALLAKAVAKKEISKARELAQAGQERTSGQQAIRYVKAERRILEREFKSCVDKYSEKDTGMEKCDKVKLAAGKVQKRLVEAADGVVSESEMETIKDEGKDLFGRPQGYVMTAFGPVYQQGAMGEFDAYRQKSVYEVMMEQQMMYQGAGMGGMMGGQFGGSQFGNQMGFGGQGARMGSPLLGGFNGIGNMNMGPMGQMGGGARGAFGQTQMAQFGGSPMRMF